MSDYWKEIYNSISAQKDSTLLRQVGKTLNGQEISESQVTLIIESIVDVLRLCPQDFLIDLCCGNGLVTKQLAPLVSNVAAFDFSGGLIEVAKRCCNAANIDYSVGDILFLDQRYFAGFKKVVMNEALQHFSEEQFHVLLDELKSLSSGSLIFIGGVPDRAKLKIYYDTEEKFAFYLQRENEGRPHMGNWWLAEEIEGIASTYGFKANFLAQNPAMHSSHYRFDVLLQKFP